MPEGLANQAETELAAGIPFTSDADLEAQLSEAGVPASTADAVTEANAESRIDGLRAAISILAVIALAALPFTRGIPTVQPGAQSKGKPADPLEPSAASA